MRTYVIVIASALLLAAAVTELTNRLWPESYLALLLLCFLALTVNGLFNARLAHAPAPAAKPSRPQTNRSRGRSSRPSHPKQKSSGKREEGTVKWFNRTKGFGFIVRESGDEIFVHQRSIQGDRDDNRRPVLRDGQKVSFEVAERDKGLQAENVAPL
ncbi:MAG: cold-shock protein [Gammaproteobacteria bacterium]|nr:cold-shock protein [Gammaproteobacteria bacterium]